MMFGLVLQREFAGCKGSVCVGGGGRGVGGGLCRGVGGHMIASA